MLINLNNTINFHSLNELADARFPRKVSQVSRSEIKTDRGSLRVW